MGAASCIVVVAALLGLAAGQNHCPFVGSAGRMPMAGVRSELYRGQQAFTVAMLDAIQKATPTENVFFSPYSTYHCLLLAYFGANGQTEKELVEALRLQWAQDKSVVNRGYRIEKENRLVRSKTMPLQFSSVDKIFVDKQVHLTECALDVFRSELEEKDFHGQPEQARVEINNWIAEVTRNEIADMLAPGDVTADTQMLLANAAYFKGQWLSKFDPEDTKREVFYSSQSKQSLVEMMHLRGTFSLAIDEHLGAYVLDMPYKTSNDENKDSEISMIIILPPFQESLETVLGKLTPDSLEKALNESMPREIDIALPKFEFKQELHLVPILRKMGINSIFDQTSDMSHFSTTSNLMFGDALHHAKIKVDEEGSTAAAATVFFSFRSARPVEPTKFECNHPFLFLIYDHKSKAVLFTGIYRDPMTQK